MRGRRNPQLTMLAFIDLEESVPSAHPLRDRPAPWRYRPSARHPRHGPVYSRPARDHRSGLAQAGPRVRG